MRLLLSSASASVALSALCFYASTRAASSSGECKAHVGENMESVFKTHPSDASAFFQTVERVNDPKELDLAIKNVVGKGEVSMPAACTVLAKKPFLQGIGGFIENEDSKFSGIIKLVDYLLVEQCSTILECLLLEQSLIARERDLYYLMVRFYGYPKVEVLLQENAFIDTNLALHMNSVFAANNRKFLDDIVSGKPGTIKTDIKELFEDFKRFIEAGVGSGIDADEIVKFFHDNGIDPAELVQVLVTEYGQGVGEKCAEFILDSDQCAGIISELNLVPTLTQKARMLSHAGVLQRLYRNYGKSSIKSALSGMKTKTFAYPLNVQVIRLLEGMGFGYTEEDFEGNLKACTKDKDCNDSLMHKQLTEFGLREKKFSKGYDVEESGHPQILIEHCKLNNSCVMAFFSECWKKEEYIEEYYNATKDFSVGMIFNALNNNVGISFFIRNLDNPLLNKKELLNRAIVHKRWRLVEAIHEWDKSLVPDSGDFELCDHPRFVSLFESNFPPEVRTKAWKWAKMHVMDKREYVEAAVELGKFDCPNQKTFELDYSLEAMSLVLEQCEGLILTAGMVNRALGRKDYEIIDFIKDKSELYPKPEFFNGRDVDSCAELAVKIYSDLRILPPQDFIEKMAINGDYRLVRPFKEANRDWPNGGFIMSQLEARKLDFIRILCELFEYPLDRIEGIREIIKNTGTDELLQFIQPE